MFKEAFRRRYKDVHTDQYHFTKLQTARQARNESPQQFTDRCKSLAQKVVLKSDNPQFGASIGKTLTECFSQVLFRDS